MKNDHPVQLQDISCPICCLKNDEIVLTGSDLLHNMPGVFQVVKCRGCGLMRTNPRPTPEAMGFFYPDDYGPYLGTRVLKTNSTSSLKRLLTPLARKIFDDKSQRLPIMVPAKMLEIGCASGAFLNQMSGLGWEVEGIEFSEKAAQNARQLGYKVYAGSLETAPAPLTLVDLIVGWFVMEHLHNPIGSLKKLHEWANPGAWLVLSVPNANALEFHLFKDKWYALQLPTHLNHYTPQSLAKVLNEGGWTLEKVHHQRSATNLIASTANVVECKGWRRLAKLLRLLMWGKWFYILFPLSWILGVLGQSGRMTVWARKRAS
ncbi:MAG: class I SAM-dependent methyltransferase [Planctomycetota bacterium]|nr:MAG: class I SAM-dependent methyltransferase [Planctomycetota bacterium]